jgi:hypothetical protein
MKAVNQINLLVLVWIGKLYHFLQSTKARRKSRYMALLFLDLFTRRDWGASTTPRLLSTPGKDPVPIVQEAGWAPGSVWTGAQNLASTGIRSAERSARSQSLYRLSYPGPLFYERILQNAQSDYQDKPLGFIRLIYFLDTGRFDMYWSAGFVIAISMYYVTWGYYYYLWLCSPARAIASSSHEVSWSNTTTRHSR